MAGCPALARAWLIRALKPAQVGLPQLVPPTPYCKPFRIMTPPLYGSAVSETSGTARIVPAGTPSPLCQEGRVNCWLMPPPVAPEELFQTTSVLALPLVLRASDVPPTPVTLGSLEGASA